MIKLKRVYEKPKKSDGQRVLVDRLWPRGLSKAKAHVDMWRKDVAPSNGLRKWFGHQPERWPAFQRKYRIELRKNKAAVAELKKLLRRGTVTLVYGAKDEQHNQAVVLKKYLS